MNALNVIFPYRLGKSWVFDDLAKNIAKEPFIAGIDVMLDDIAGPNASSLIAIFSSKEFPRYTHKLEKIKEEHGGAWYKEKSLSLDGWLCPVLMKYFPSPPEEIFIQIKEDK